MEGTTGKSEKRKKGTLKEAVPMKQVGIRDLSQKDEEQLVETIFNMLVGLEEDVALDILASVEGDIENNLIVAPRLKDRLHQDGGYDRT